MEGVFFIGWLVLCGIVAFIAKERGRGPVAWFVVAFVLSPLIGYATLVAIPMVRRAGEGGYAPVRGILDSGDDRPIFNEPPN